MSQQAIPSAPSLRTAGEETGFLKVDESAERDQIESLRAWRAERDGAAAMAALVELKRAAAEGRNVMEPSIACAHAGVTTGEWGQALRAVFGEYRAPTGVAKAAPGGDAASLASVRQRVRAVSDRLGRRLKFLVGKPGLDGHSNGAEQIAVRARDCGFEVVYEGIRLTPAQIVNAALEEGVHVVGLSVLSGSHVALAREVLAGLRQAGIGEVPLVLGGIVPPEDEKALRDAGVARVFTPKDYDLTRVMDEIVTIVDGAYKQAAE